METGTTEELVKTELGDEEIEFIEIKVETEEIPSDVEVETSAPLSPKAPLSDVTLPGQQILFLHGTGTGQTIKFVSASGRDPSDPSRPLTFEPAIKPVTTQRGGNISGLRPGVTEKVVSRKTRKTIMKPLTSTCKSVFIDELSELAPAPEKNYCTKVTCNECGKRFSNRLILIKHIKKNHPVLGKSSEVAGRKGNRISNTNTATCDECGQDFSKRYNLVRHIRQFHPEKLSEVGGEKRTRINNVTCNECGSFFSKHYNFIRHVKKFHPDKIKDRTKQNEYKYLCDQCGKNFGDVKNLKRHHKTHTDRRKTLKCPVCRDDENFDRSEIWQHFELCHGVKVSSENVKFSCESDFYSWKSQIEKVTHCYFINEHGSDSTKGYKRKKFTCHRSGPYSSRGSGIRNLKAQETNKLPGYCPAEIVLKVFHNGECEVEFIKVHVGHDQDLRRSTLIKSELDGTVKKRIKLKCPICRNDEEYEKSEILQHFGIVHHIKLISRNLKFSCENEFSSWKNQIEKETNCYFVSNHGSHSTKYYKRNKFVCHRSVTYETREIRNMKAQGTDVISGFCPAEIVLKIFRNGEYNVEFVDVHLGHNQDITAGGAVKKRQNLKCPICRNDDKYGKSEIWQHFEIFHDIKLSPETLRFSSEDDFDSWKSQIEKETHCSFINEHGSDSRKTYVRKKYVCHRSGTYKPKGSRKRNLKAQGSNKISGFCPAEIVLKTFRNGECEVEFVNVHVGHDQDLGHITLSKSERESIAAKIAAKVPYKKILDEVREESTSESKFERIHLLKRKDLHNIKQCFNLDRDREAVKDSKEPVSDDASIKEIEDMDCVLFHKPEDTLSETYPELEPKDIVLIVMNEDQTKLLQKFSSDIVCIDRTYGLDNYEFELVTLLVVDDMREGFPAAFLITNRTDEAVMAIFFSVIKEKLGRNLEPNIFMSDLDESFYNAWLQIMGPAELRLICSWHVDRDWRENLSQINGEEKQIEVYKNLRILLQENDESSFVQMCSDFMEYLLSDSVTEEFGAYFQENYLNDVQSWAYCYRINCGINTNMHLERMHQTLKQLKRICFSGKAIKGLDGAVDALMKFVHDKLFDRLLVKNKVKISTKIKVLRSRHQASEKLDVEDVNETDSGFEVQSSSRNEVYLVQERQPTCDCETLCPECQICLHRYSCTCIDSCIRLNMCKHIHLVCRLLKKNNTPTNTQVVNINSPVESDDQNETNNCEQQEIDYEAPTPTLASGKEKKEANDVDGVKEKLALKLHKIIADIKSPEELNAIEKLIAPIEPALVAMRERESAVVSNKAPKIKAR